MAGHDWNDIVVQIAEDYISDAKEHEDNWTKEDEKRIRDFVLYCQQRA